MRRLLASALLLLSAAPLAAQSETAAQDGKARGEAFNRGSGPLLARYRFSGQFGMSAPGSGVMITAPRLAAGGPPPLWRWASVTKQVTAILVMQEVAAGRIALDQPVARYLPAFASANAGAMTVRQLLQHRSGLPNTDAADGAYHRPGFAGSRDPLTGYCAGPVTGAPGGSWSYNNCDYIVAGALLRSVTGKPWKQLVQDRIARPLGLKTLGAFPARRLTRPGFNNGRPEPVIDLATYGAAGGLFGSAHDLLALDDALIAGRLLPKAQLAEMWDGNPELGFIALGQWSFTAPLKGCAKPVWIVERRGAIGGVQVRNFILPDLKTSVVAFTDRGEFDFGEIWQGSGFGFDLLSLAACLQEQS